MLLSSSSKKGAERRRGRRDEGERERETASLSQPSDSLVPFFWPGMVAFLSRRHLTQQKQLDKESQMAEEEEEEIKPNT